MFQRLSRSWELVKASASVLRQDKELLWFPVMSTIALLVVIAAFLLPIMGLASLDSMAREDGSTPPIVYVIVFLFYFANYFVIFFFNTALVGAAMIRLDGGDPTFKDGMRIAGSKIAVLLGYAFIAATVGMILRMIQERVGFIGKIVVGIIGVGWSLATFLVVPVLADREVGPIDAIKESAHLFTETWGESVIGQAGIGLAFGLIMGGIGVVGAALVMLAMATGSGFLIGTMVLVMVVAFGITALVKAALEGIYAAALYRYASNKEGSVGFPVETLEAAFAPKG
jgi:hypothetical protein